MDHIQITKEHLLKGTELLSGTPRDTVLKFSKEGSGLELPELLKCNKRYLTFYLELLEDHSLPMNFFAYSREESQEKPAFNLRFGIIPKVKALVCIDLNLLDASILFPEHTEGMLKIVCHGRRIEPEEVSRITFTNYPCFHDVKIRLSDMLLTDKKPKEYPLPDIKLIDELGQYKPKAWPGKLHSIEELRQKLQKADRMLPEGYSNPDFSSYGGYALKKLTSGTGFFSKVKAEGRWWLVDPLGYAFFSMGPDCTAVRSDCRVDGIEKFMDWLPETSDPVYGGMYGEWKSHSGQKSNKRGKLFSFEKANLYRVFGEEWFFKWISITRRQLKQNGLNTLGNWSDHSIFDKMEMPYVTMLPDFPTTTKKIFRDFPDVFSQEYEESAVVAAESLRARREDPYLIGYFLSNEPAWAFVNNLVIADEVLLNPAVTACKIKLITALRGKYHNIEDLNSAWKSGFGSFEELYKPIRKASGLSAAANEDLRAFSRLMLDRYISIPSKACQAVDKNHMNLGIRWAWISDPDVVTGWENFDVFSINCYSMDPTESLENVRKLGVDLPVVIGEFHFGALDRGLTATGLEAVKTQEDRGMAYRYYCERVAAHPLGVGCHYFQLYDQFALGRFDGENYNIGLFDICSQPYREMMDAIHECSDVIYEVASGTRKPVLDKPESIPMIAY